MHWHRWEIVGVSEQPSAFQQMVADGRLTALDGVPSGAFVVPVIVTYRCPCGAEKVVRV